MELSILFNFIFRILQTRGFMKSKGFTLAELATFTNSKLIGNPSHRITCVADLDSAGPEDASFLSNSRYISSMQQSQAGVIFIDSTTAHSDNRNFLINANPSEAFQKTLEAFYDPLQDISGFLGIHETVVLHPSCQIGKNVSIGPYAVVDKDVKIGDGTFIGAACYIGSNTVVGTNCHIHPHVTIRERCIIGDRVILQPGSVIGSCGFGYVTDKKGHHTKLNQVGTVTIENDVEIGANAIVDRARFKTTLIGQGTKIGGLADIAHNVKVGKHNIIVGQAAIAGSSETGNNVILAGQVGVAGHLKIADGAIITAKSGVTKSITKPGKYGGHPAIPLAEYNRNGVFQRKIETYAKEIQDLQRKIEALEGKL